MLNRGFFWTFTAVALGFALAGWFLLFSAPVPQDANIDQQRIEEFFSTQIWVSAALGLVLGVVLGMAAVRRIRHRPKDYGVDYLGRVVSFGVQGALVIVVAVFLVETLVASVWGLAPLAPLEKVLLLVPSGLFSVLLALAFTASLVSYAFVTRAATWGGQYAVIPKRGP